MDSAKPRLDHTTPVVSNGAPAASDGPSHDCEHCAALLGDGGALARRLASAVGTSSSESSSASGSSSARSESDFHAMEALLDRERGLRAFLRSRPTRVRWILCLSLPLAFMLRELARKRVPLGDLGAPRLLAGVALLAVLGWVLKSALEPLPIERRAARRRRLLAVFAWCVPFLLFLTPAARATAPGFSGSFAFRSLSCFAYGSLLSAPSFALIWALDRGVRVPFRVWALGAGTVAVAANLILMLHCPITDPAHLLAGHFSIGLAWFSAVLAAEWWQRRVE